MDEIWFGTAQPFARGLKFSHPVWFVKPMESSDSSTPTCERISFASAKSPRTVIASGLAGSAGAGAAVANYCFGALRRRTVTDWTVCGAISTVSEDAAGFRPSFGAMEITA